MKIKQFKKLLKITVDFLKEIKLSNKSKNHYI
jgi:hypothetical protein